MESDAWTWWATFNINAGDMDDAKILRDLFDGTGVMSALDHSKIEGANNPEALNIDAQAARIARKAAEALKRSRQACQVQRSVFHMRCSSGLTVDWRLCALRPYLGILTQQRELERCRRVLLRDVQLDALRLCEWHSDSDWSNLLGAQAAPVNQPTWTGRSGATGTQQRFGAASNTRMLPPPVSASAGSQVCRSGGSISLCRLRVWCGLIAAIFVLARP